MTRFLLSPMLIVLLLLSEALAQAGSDAQKLKQVQLENIDVSMFLALQGDVRHRRDWPTEPVHLVAAATSTDGKTIQELLTANHIFPDVEAFSVVYSLNPGINNLTGLDRISELRIPKVEAGPDLSKLLNEEYAILLTVDKRLKDRFVKRVGSVKQSTHLIATAAESHFKDPGQEDTVVHSLNLISSWLDKISDRITHRYGRPMPTEVIVQLNGDADLLDKTLIKAAAPGQKIGEDQSRQIEALRNDVQLKVKSLSEVAAGEAPDRWPEVKVSVKTFQAGHETLLLRIYYVPEALQTQPTEFRSFGKLSSPSNQSLPEADYCFWAARDPSPKRVTGIQCSEVRIDQMAEIDLTVSGKEGP